MTSHGVVSSASNATNATMNTSIGSKTKFQKVVRAAVKRKKSLENGTMGFDHLALSPKQVNGHTSLGSNGELHHMYICLSLLWGNIYQAGSICVANNQCPLP